MMKIFNNPPATQWSTLAKRPELELEYLDSTVKNILARVKKSGDQALKDFALQYDKVALSQLQVSEVETQKAIASISPSLKAAIEAAYQNIFSFHNAQQTPTLEVETMPGVVCQRRAVAIERVGIYIPGGTAPLFSTVLMLGVPAKIAGCKEVVLCTPPSGNGSIHPAILFTASLVGISKIYKVGGAQAIAAMAYGTDSIPSVNKIFGPGNQFVTKAKQLMAMEGMAIDMPAGPSEVLVLADGSASADFVAADLLSQAEHGADSQVVLVTTASSFPEKVNKAIEKQLQNLPRKEIAQESLLNSRCLLFDDEALAFDFINFYAPEHLIINCQDAGSKVEKVVNAGSVFVGEMAAEAAGDFASGTNHTLPTNGFAKAYSGVSLSSFQKFITVQTISKEGMKRLGPIVEAMAEAENLMGHKNAISIRLKSLGNK
jgi:histidinol dehydrogenase